MERQPYVRFKKEELTLRDYLAADRTALANERTLLSYARTALGVALAGGSLIHFFTSMAADIAGWVLLVLAGVTFAWGLWRFLWYRQRIENVQLK